MESSFVSSSYCYASLYNLVLFKFLQIIPEYFIIVNFSSCVKSTKRNLILFPSYNDLTSKAFLKNYKLIYLWLLTSILRVFTLSRYPLPSDINDKLMLFEISPLKDYFEWLKVFCVTIKYLAVVFHQILFI